MNIKRKPGLSFDDQLKASTLKTLFDIKTLDLYCRYVISRNANIRLNGVALVQNLFKKVNIESYGKDEDRVKRVRFILRGLEARLDKHLKDPDIIIQYINGGLLSEDILDTSHFEEISDEELGYINEQSSSLAKSYFVDDLFEEIHKLSAELHTNVLVNRQTTVDKIEDLSTRLSSAFNRINSAISTEPEVSFQRSDFKQIFRDIYSRETSPSRCLKTGLVGLNRMLDGGFYSGRVYIFFGTAATGKSFLALDTALQIAKYNKGYKTQDPTKRPCIIFLTMENSVQENMSRIFNMITGEPMKETNSFDEAYDIFSKALKEYTGGEINLYMEYQPYLSQNTNYLYQLVDKAKADGEEPICIIQDHIKRIRPVEQTRDMRQDLGNIVNEFKSFANTMDIPVLTISHLNRDAAKSIGENKNRKDVIRTLGSNNVSDSLLMVDNCDVGIILNKEMDSNKEKYMGFMQIKTRTKCDLDVFFQPFMKDRSLKMVEDVDERQPLYKWTLMDKQLSSLRNYTGSDYVSKKNVHDDDDADMFSRDNMAEVTEDEDDEEELLLRNENQDKFVVGGKPSKPIFKTLDLNSLVDHTSSSNSIFDNSQAQTPWEKELMELMYKKEMRHGVCILDDDGEAISDGIMNIPEFEY